MAVLAAHFGVVARVAGEGVDILHVDREAQVGEIVPLDDFLRHVVAERHILDAQIAGILHVAVAHTAVVVVVQVVNAGDGGLCSWCHIDIPYVEIAAVAVSIGPLGIVAGALKLVPGRPAGRQRRVVHTAARPVEHLVAHTAVHEDAQCKLLPGDGVVPSEGILGQSVAEECLVVVVDDAVSVEVFEQQVADACQQVLGRGVAHHGAHAVVGGGGNHCRGAVAVVAQEVGSRVDASGHLESIELADAVADSRTGDGLAGTFIVEGLVDESRLAVQLGHLVLDERVGERRLPLQLFLVDDRGIQCHLDTRVAHVADVGPLRLGSSRHLGRCTAVERQCRLHEQVAGVLPEGVEDEFYARVEEVQVQTDIPRVGLLPCQFVVVGHVGRFVAGAEVRLQVGEVGHEGALAQIGVTHQSVAHAHLQ